MLVGRYELRETIGRGASAVVYRGRAPDGRDVALKLFQRTDPAAFARFERERRLLGELGELDGFVPLLDSGEVQGNPYVVMPFVGGGTLRERLHRGPLSAEETLGLARALSRALARAHERGVVHRDLKPENILFTSDGRPLIADLGIAKHFSPDGRSVSLSKTGEVRGTIGYMAAEQLTDAKTAKPSADIFALGAILYECLDGAPAFAGEDVMTVISEIERGRVRPIARKAVPASFVALIERSLSRDPSRRPADGLAFERALVASRRRRRPIAAVVAAFVLAAAATGGALVATRKPGAPPPHAPPMAPPAPVASNLLPAECRAFATTAALRLRHVLGNYRRKFADRVTDVAISDGLLVGADTTGYVRASDLASDAPRWTNRIGATALAFVPGGRQLVAGLVSGELVLLDARTGDPVGELPTQKNARITALAVSPDGKYVLAGNVNGAAPLFDLAARTERVTLLGHTKSIQSVDFSRDGRDALTAGQDGWCKLWNPETLGGREEDVKIESMILSAAFSPDGRKLALGSNDTNVHIYDRDKKQFVTEAKAYNWVFAVHWLDATRVLAGSSGTQIFGFDARTGDRLVNIQRHTGQVTVVRGVPGQRAFVTASWDGTVRLWADTADTPEIRPIEGHAGPVFGVAWTADGQRIVTTGRDGSVRTWRARDGRAELLNEGGTIVRSLAVTRDGKWAVLGTEARELHAVDLATGRRAIQAGHDDRVARVALLGNGDIVTASYDGSLGLAKPGGPVEEKIPLVRWKLQTLAASHKGRLLLVGDEREDVVLLDLDRREPETIARHVHGPMAMAFSPDDSVAYSLGIEGDLVATELATHRTWQAQPHAANADALAVSPTGDLVATGGMDGLTLLRAHDLTLVGSPGTELEFAL